MAATGGRGWWRSSGGGCGATRFASASVSGIESGIWSGTESGSLGATATATVIATLTLTSTLIATRSLSARPSWIWSETVTWRAGCMRGHSPLCPRCCLDLCFVTGAAVCRGVWRGCGGGRGVRPVMDREWVLVLSPALAPSLGGCSRRCHRSACAAWRAVQEPSPRAQDPTLWYGRSLRRLWELEPGVSCVPGLAELKQSGLRQNGTRAPSSKQQQADPSQAEAVGGRQKRAG